MVVSSCHHRHMFDNWIWSKTIQERQCMWLHAASSSLWSHVKGIKFRAIYPHTGMCGNFLTCSDVCSVSQPITGKQLFCPKLIQQRLEVGCPSDPSPQHTKLGRAPTTKSASCVSAIFREIRLGVIWKFQGHPRRYITGQWRNFWRRFWASESSSVSLPFSLPSTSVCVKSLV